VLDQWHDIRRSVLGVAKSIMIRHGGRGLPWSFYIIFFYVDKKQNNKVKVYIILKETKFKIKFYT
jgi:hypothetical protein